jgi:hypothetical protein
MRKPSLCAFEEQTSADYPVSTGQISYQLGANACIQETVSADSFFLKMALLSPLQ